MRLWKRCTLLLGALVAPAPLASPASAEVVRIEVARREPFADGHEFGAAGAYERISGRLLISLDPAHAANRETHDIRLAPTTREGRIEFRTDFDLLRPVDASRASGRLVYEVDNRGNKLLIGAMNGARANDPRTLADAGNGFLMRRGYTLLWCAWNGDVEAGDGRLQIDLPVARNPDGSAVTGRVYSEICVERPSQSEPLCWGNTRVYPAEPVDQQDATLSMRPDRESPPVVVPRSAWAFAGLAEGRPVPDPTRLYLTDGFRPGWLYDLVYTARDPRVSGLGALAIRDAVSFFRYAEADADGNANPLAGGVRHTLAFGISQSARFLNHYLWRELNADVQGRPVFDGVFAHVGAGARGLFDQRFAQITRHGSQHEERLYPTDVFPFATVPQADSQTGHTGDWLERSRRSGTLPKIVLTATSTEYWNRGGSLLHTDVEGRNDIGLDPAVRLYVIAGAHHLYFTPDERDRYAYPPNALDYQPVLRALLVALDAWVSGGREPPASRYPTIRDGTLVSVEQYARAFPRIPDVRPPARPYAPLRLDAGSRWESHGIADIVPPRAGAPFHVLVPAIDRDGNELAGVRLPQVSVPLATHAGWNTRTARIGAEGALARWTGSSWTFPRDQVEAGQSGDSRTSIVERYADAGDYARRVWSAAEAMRSNKLLLEEDLEATVEAAGRQYAAIVSR